eukprot:m.571600 g.571600  ORF g.571600 m.571600 type:complete len:70 (-) comp57861_c1_seq9:123-332(-)
MLRPGELLFEIKQKGTDVPSHVTEICFDDFLLIQTEHTPAFSLGENLVLDARKTLCLLDQTIFRRAHLD